ncbi:MAG: hypothetical protein ACK2UJ_05675, partial [Candidatus Promineifilaceae bacterium]
MPVEIETRKSSKGNPYLCPIFGQYLAELPPKRLDLSRFYLSIIFSGTTERWIIYLPSHQFIGNHCDMP